MPGALSIRVVDTTRFARRRWLREAPSVTYRRRNVTYQRRIQAIGRVVSTPKRVISTIKRVVSTPKARRPTSVTYQRGATRGHRGHRPNPTRWSCSCRRRCPRTFGARTSACSPIAALPAAISPLSARRQPATGEPPVCKRDGGLLSPRLTIIKKVRRFTTDLLLRIDRWTTHAGCRIASSPYSTRSAITAYHVQALMVI